MSLPSIILLNSLLERLAAQKKQREESSSVEHQSHGLVNFPYDFPDHPPQISWSPKDSPTDDDTYSPPSYVSTSYSSDKNDNMMTISNRKKKNSKPKNINELIHSMEPSDNNHESDLAQKHSRSHVSSDIDSDHQRQTNQEMSSEIPF